MHHYCISSGAHSDSDASVSPPLLKRKGKGKGKGKGKPPSKGKPPIKEKKGEDFVITEKQEKEAMLFIRSQEGIWRRVSQDYKRRKEIMGSLATQLELPVDGLLKWWKTLRDWHRKVVKNKSGSKAAKRTDRENWLVQQLSYLKVEEVTISSITFIPENI